MEVVRFWSLGEKLRWKDKNVNCTLLLGGIFRNRVNGFVRLFTGHWLCFCLGLSCKINIFILVKRNLIRCLCMKKSFDKIRETAAENKRHEQGGTGGCSRHKRILSEKNWKWGQEAGAWDLSKNHGSIGCGCQAGQNTPGNRACFMPGLM